MARTLSFISFIEVHSLLSSLIIFHHLSFFSCCHYHVTTLSLFSHLLIIHTSVLNLLWIRHGHVIRNVSLSFLLNTVLLYCNNMKSVKNSIKNQKQRTIGRTEKRSNFYEQTEFVIFEFLFHFTTFPNITLFQSRVDG